ncbi:MAG: hypothetical protein WC593_15620 [Methanoregula sp.]
MPVANFDFELEHKLQLIVHWRLPASSDEEKHYRNNIELAVQEMALMVQIQTEETSKPIVAEMVKRLKELWESHNKVEESQK